MLKRGEISSKVVAEWDKASKGLSLPERVRKKKARKRARKLLGKRRFKKKI